MMDLATAVALVFVIEGVLYALFPEAMKRMMAAVLDQPVTVLRTAGVIAAVMGVGIVWILRG